MDDLCRRVEYLGESLSTPVVGLIIIFNVISKPELLKIDRMITN